MREYPEDYQHFERHFHHEEPLPAPLPRRGLSDKIVGSISKQARQLWQTQELTRTAEVDKVEARNRLQRLGRGLLHATYYFYRPIFDESGEGSYEHNEGRYFTFKHDSQGTYFRITTWGQADGHGIAWSRMVPGSSRATYEALSVQMTSQNGLEDGWRQSYMNEQPELLPARRRMFLREPGDRQRIETEMATIISMIENEGTAFQLDDTEFPALPLVKRVKISNQ